MHAGFIDRAVEAGLIVCLWAAALGIGGTEPFTLAAVQMVLFGVLVALLWRPGSAALPWLVPGLLVGWVGAQWLLLAADGYSARAHLPRLVAYLAAFLAAAHLSRVRSAPTRLAAALVLLALVEAVAGLVQYLAGWQQIYHLKKAHYTAHATGTYVNPNHFAGLLAMTMPLAFAAALAAWERLARPEGDCRHREPFPAQAVAFSFLTALLFLAVLFSRSRGGLLAAGAGLVLTGAVWLAGSRRPAPAAAAAAALLLATAAMGMWIGLEPVAERYETASRDVGERLAVWRDALRLISERPLTGSGFGSFGDVYPRVQTAHLAFTVPHAHNDYLQLATELGVPAAALLGAAWIMLVGRVARAATAGSKTTTDRALAAGVLGGVAAMLFHALLDFNLQMPANALVFAALLGMLTGMNRHAEREGGGRRAAPDEPR